MGIKSAICFGLAVAALAALPAPVSAQALLPPHEITTSVRSMGLRPLSPPVRRGMRYVVRAVDGRGYELRVVADASTGRILAVRPLGYGQGYGYGPYRPGPAYAERQYPPPYYPEETVPPRANNRRLPGNPPSEPSVIYAPRGTANAPQPPARIPSAAKPLAPKVAAKPPARQPAPAPAETAAAPEQQADSTTGTTPASPPAENPAFSVPPVQSLE